MDGLYTEESFLQIVMVTGLIGGGAAWLAGRATARTWRPIGHVIVYMLLLGAAVRFVHFALFEGELLAVPSYLADTLYLIVAGTLSWRITRTNQMVTQYDWLYERTGTMNWRARTTPLPEHGGSKTSSG